MLKSAYPSKSHLSILCYRQRFALVIGYYLPMSPSNHIKLESRGRVLAVCTIGGTGAGDRPFLWYLGS